jgi:hypothetical protein
MQISGAQIAYYQLNSRICNAPFNSPEIRSEWSASFQRHPSQDRALKQGNRPETLPDMKWFLENRGLSDSTSRRKRGEFVLAVESGFSVAFLCGPGAAPSQLPIRESAK